MSTLAYHHDGLERVLRGLAFVVSYFHRTEAPSREGRSAAHATVAAGTKAGTAAAAAAADGTAAVGSERLAAAVAAKQHTVAKTGSLWSNWRSALARRRAERDFREAMLADPRMQAEWNAITSYREWHS